MIRHCSICGELRTLVPTHARCWKCAAEDLWEKPEHYEPPPSVLENIEVTRMVERRDGKFELLFVHDCPTNVHGMVCASVYFGMVEMWAKPIWSVKKTR